MQIIASGAGRSWNDGDFMELNFENIEVDKDYSIPALKLNTSWKYGNNWEALLNTYGRLKFKGKVIGRLELAPTIDYQFVIKPLNPPQQDDTDNSVLLSFTCVLDANTINILNTARKSESKGDVLLQAEITIVPLITQNGYMLIMHRKSVFNIAIKASDWFHDFLPGLGVGEYEVIEMPKIDVGQEGLKDAVDMLNEAKRKLYGDLDIGACLTILRNSLTKFNDFISKKGGFEKLFDDNKNIINLAEDLQEKLHGAASRSQDSTAAHTGGAKVEGYEAESMIFMAYSLYKLVIDRIKSRGP